MRKLLHALVFSAAAALACSDTTAPPQPGTLTVRLTTPHTDDAAILLRVTGPNAVELTSANEAYALHQRRSNGSIQVAVFGTLATGALATFTVADVARADDYRVTVIEVSDASNALRADVSGYRLSITR